MRAAGLHMHNRRTHLEKARIAHPAQISHGLPCMHQWVLLQSYASKRYVHTILMVSQQSAASIHHAGMVLQLLLHVGTTKLLDLGGFSRAAHPPRHIMTAGCAQSAWSKVHHAPTVGRSQPSSQTAVTPGGSCARQLTSKPSGVTCRNFSCCRAGQLAAILPTCAASTQCGA